MIQKMEDKYKEGFTEENINRLIKMYASSAISGSKHIDFINLQLDELRRRKAYNEYKKKYIWYKIGGKKK